MLKGLTQLLIFLILSNTTHAEVFVQFSASSAPYDNYYRLLKACTASWGVDARPCNTDELYLSGHLPNPPANDYTYLVVPSTYYEKFFFDTSSGSIIEKNGLIGSSTTRACVYLSFSQGISNIDITGCSLNELPVLCCGNSVLKQETIFLDSF